MATVISMAGRREAKARPEKKPPRSLSPGTIVVMFTAVALAMTAAAVIVGANSWDDAVTLVILISVVALLKLALANLMFIAMLRADEQTDRRLIAEEPKPEPTPSRSAPKVVQRPNPPRPRPAQHNSRPHFELVEGRALATHEATHRGPQR